jgi:XTP/dITP diphosphohydrolase
LAPRGQGGFGYDPLFIPEGHEATFAELGEEVKNQMSHRGRALALLRSRIGD